MAQFNMTRHHGTGASRWVLPIGPKTNVLARGCSSWGRLRSPRPSCWRYFCVPASPARVRLELGRDLLDRFGSLHRLFAAPLEDVAAVRGLGPPSMSSFRRWSKWPRRALAEQIQDRDAMSSPQAVRDYLRLSLGARPHEVFVAMFLDAQNRLLGCEELFRGTSDANQRLPTRGCEDGAALQRCRRYLCAQSSLRRRRAEPRRRAPDARRCKQALSLVEIKTLDHFIVAGSQTMSFAERGLL